MNRTIYTAYTFARFHLILQVKPLATYKNHVERKRLMIKGIGLDIVEIERIHDICKRQPRFPLRILTTEELQVYEQLSEQRKIEYLSGRFAAKEAYAKANGTGIGDQLSFLDIETSYDQNGKPIIVKPRREKVYLSITHTRTIAAAQVIIEGDDFQ